MYVANSRNKVPVQRVMIKAVPEINLGAES